MECKTCDEHGEFLGLLGSLRGSVRVIVGLLVTILLLSVYNGRQINSIDSRLSVVEAGFTQSRDRHDGELKELTGVINKHSIELARQSLICCSELD